LQNAGCRVLYADLTTPDLVAYPIRVVRTLATGLQPIHFGYGEERLGGKRVYQLPRALGYSTSDRDEASFNPCPHPLP
jgi:ribosomal protein S12 methylthiotransferase accessory factor